MDRELLSLIHLLSNKESFSLNDIISLFNITKRQATYRIEKLNQILDDNKVERITLTTGKNKQLLISKKTSDYFKKIIEMQNNEEVYIFDKNERMTLLYLMMFINPDYLSLLDFVDVLEVSRSSVLLDLKDLMAELEKNDVQVVNNRQKGYHLIGDELDIRKVMMHSLAFSLQKQFNSNVFDSFIEYYHLDIYNYTKLLIEELAAKHNIRFVEDRLQEFIYIFIFIKARVLNGKTLDNDSAKLSVDAINTMDEFLFTNDLLEHFHIKDKVSIHEVNYLSSWILGVSFGDINKESKDCLLISDLVGKIMERFSYLSSARYTNIDEIFIKLYAHVRPAYYRLIFKLPIFNPLCQRVKEEFGELYQLVDETMKPFKVIFGSEIPEDEIAYLTMHFALIYFDEKKEEENDQVTALVVCSNGIGSSAVLYNELRGMFPEINFLPPLETSSLYNYEDKVDIIFSSNYARFETNLDVPIIKVAPIMSLKQRYVVYKEVYKYLKDRYNNKTTSVDDIMAIIKKYCIVKEEQNLYDELVSYIAQCDTKVRNEEGLGLLDLIDKDMIEFDIEAKDWKDAINKAYQPLLRKGYIRQEYIDDTIKSLELNGPYIVIMPSVALSHTKPEKGALKYGLSLSVLKKPIEFNSKENDPVRFIFSLSALDDHHHLKAMAQLVELLNNDKFFKLLESTNDAKLVYDCITNIINN